MGKKTYILILAFSIIGAYLDCLNAQNSLSYVRADRETYVLYVQGRWQELIAKGKHALKNGIDYFYLRVRMGIAYYHLGKYRLSIKHLIKAHKNNPTDPFVNEFLTYSFLAVGDLERAFYHYKLLPDHIKTRISLFKTKIYRTDFNLQAFANSDYQQLTEQSTAVAEIDKNAYGFYAGYNTSLSQKLYLYQMLFIHQVNTTFFDTSQTGETYQISINQTTSGTTGSSSSTGYTGGTGQDGMGPRNASLDTDSINSNVPLYQFPIKSYQTRLFSSFRWLMGKRTSFVFHNNLGYYDKSFLFAIGSTMLLEQPLFTLGFRADFLYFNTSFYSFGLILLLYPFMNDKFYLRVEPVFSNQAINDEPIVRVEAGFRVKKVYVSGGFYYGTIPNYLEDNGYFVYATNRFISGQKFLNISITGRKISFYTTVLHSVYSGFRTPAYNGLLVRTGLVINLWNSVKKSKIQKP